MNISKEDKSSLILLLTEVIPKCTAMSYGVVRVPGKWEGEVKSSLSDKFFQQLSKNLDDGGLTSFLRRYIAERIIMSGRGFPPKIERELNAVPISSYPEFSDALSAAREMVGFIEKLPLQYEIAIPIFHDVTDRFPDNLDLKISDRMRLESGVRVADRFETSTGNEEIDRVYTSFNMSESYNTFLRDDIAYLTYRTSGYVSDLQKPKCFLDFYDDIRAFFGVCIAFGICDYMDFLSSKENVVIIGNSLGSERVYAIGEIAETDISEATNSFFEADEDELGTIEGVAEIFAPVVQLFNSPEVDRLRTASIWLLRSNLSSRGMDKILDASIAIEVLLGDRAASDRIGLSKLMANRCAYSLGKSSKARSEIYEFFMEFYRVRSEIVHSGRLGVSKEERNVVLKGVALASRILQHEIGMS